MLTCIKLDGNIQCEFVCSRIQKALTNYIKQNPDHKDNLILVIDIKQISDDNSSLPKLTFNSPS